MRLALAAALLALSGCHGCRPAAPILTWHAIGPGGDEFTVGEAAFGAQLDWLVARGYESITLHELLDGANLTRSSRQTGAGAAAPAARPVVLTFDDGTEDAFTRVLPALRARGLRGTFFIVTDFVGEDAAHRKPGYLIWPEIRALRDAGMEIGSHGLDHARLPDLPRERVREELTQSRRALEAHLGAPVDVLAYPFNSVRNWVRDEAAAAGYRAAVAGSVHGSGDALELYRIGVYRSTTLQELEHELRR